jgi:hypothetical protein
LWTAPSPAICPRRSSLSESESAPEHHGNIGIGQILVEGWLPDYPRQTAEQKSRDLSLRHDVDPTEWWRQPEEGLKG